MSHSTLSLLGRSVLVLSCAAAVVLSGCGNEVKGQGSLGGGHETTPETPDTEPGPDGGSDTEVVPPPTGAVVDYQIGGAYRPAPDVEVVIRDHSEKPVSGVYSICYINAFQAQTEGVSEWVERNPDLLLRTAGGSTVEDEDWGEPLLDISTTGKRERLAEIVGRWMGQCADRGYRAVELDNLDSWTRSSGLLKKSNAVDYATLLVERAHGHGLAAAQKNAAELSDHDIARVGFDLAIAEECQMYSWGRLTECDRYMSVYGDHMIEIEYADNGNTAFTEACRARGDRISVLFRDRDVTPQGQRGYINRTC